MNTINLKEKSITFDEMVHSFKFSVKIVVANNFDDFKDFVIKIIGGLEECPDDDLFVWLLYSASSFEDFFIKLEQEKKIELYKFTYSEWEDSELFFCDAEKISSKKRLKGNLSYDYLTSCCGKSVIEINTLTKLNSLPSTFMSSHLLYRFQEPIMPFVIFEFNDEQWFFARSTSR